MKKKLLWVASTLLVLIAVGFLLKHNLQQKRTTDGIDIPDQKTTDKLIENKINLNTYYNFKKDLKKDKKCLEQKIQSLMIVQLLY